MFSQYRPNERIVDRAVAIWIRALAAPIYAIERPGATCRASLAVSALAAAMPRNNTPAVLAAFGAALKQLLMTEQVSERDPAFTYYETYLAVDYHPCPLLEKAAKAAGLVIEFPYKTGMTLHPTHLSFHMGYGMPDLYHYPMEDGKWLVAELQGRDIAKVIAMMQGGASTLTVETDQPDPAPAAEDRQPADVCSYAHCAAHA